MNKKHYFWMILLIGSIFFYGCVEKNRIVSKNEIGKVKWFNESKGFGFIQYEEGDDLFVHHLDIIGTGSKTLEEGEEVEFDTMKGDKGLKAINVRKLQSE